MTSDDDPKQPFDHSLTTKLDIVERRTIVVQVAGRFGSLFEPKEVKYHSVPFEFKTQEKPLSWRLELKFGSPTPHTTLGLDMYGDVVFGRGKDGDSPPDVDLTALDAQKLGVSRRHALIRPTPTKLYLLDLGSTNGTSLNAMPIGQGMTKALKSGDMIALGDLGFVIEIIATPPTPDGPPEAGEQKAESPEPPAE
jgi:hypothetical protein